MRTYYWTIDKHLTCIHFDVFHLEYVCLQAANEKEIVKSGSRASWLNAILDHVVVVVVVKVVGDEAILQSLYQLMAERIQKEINALDAMPER
jgi:hypothetical protein